MPASNPTSGIGLALTGAGALFIFAGIRGYSVLAVVQNLVSGKPPTTGVDMSAPLTVASEPSTGDGGGVSLGRASGSGNKALGQAIAGEYSWGSGAEWDALNKLWIQESDWNNHADNPSSHAYGIPQALPYSKMPKAAWPESAGGQSDPATQIRWGLDYIKGRYGSPSMAWAHEQTNNWY